MLLVADIFDRLSRRLLIKVRIDAFISSAQAIGSTGPSMLSNIPAKSQAERPDNYDLRQLVWVDPQGVAKLTTPFQSYRKTLHLPGK